MFNLSNEENSVDQKVAYCGGVTWYFLFLSFVHMMAPKSNKYFKGRHYFEHMYLMGVGENHCLEYNQFIISLSKQEINY